MSAAAGQHAHLGLTEALATARHTRHPEAQWFGEAALGLFIHWGISSVHGGIDLSWGMVADKPWDAGERPGQTLVRPAEYWALAERFRPDQYHPDRWLAAAAAAGFRYAVLTCRHHDGYALWPSDHGDFGVKQYLPGVDLVAPFVEACRRHGLKVGLYYSPPDWYRERETMSFHYGSTQPERYPGRAHYGQHHEPLAELPPPPPEFAGEQRAYLRGQIVELLTRYGRIDLLWFDGGPDVISLNELRALQPHLVVNPRMHGQADYTTPECRLPDGPIEGWWELCDIWPQSGWGYARSSEQYKPLSWLLTRLAHCCAWGGNLLVNVAPRPNGELPDAGYARFAELAEWLHHSGEAVFGVQPGPYPSPSNALVTVRGSTWYLWLTPDHSGVVTVSAERPPQSVRLLHTGASLPFTGTGRGVTVTVPQALRSPEVDVLAVDW